MAQELVEAFHGKILAHHKGEDIVFTVSLKIAKWSFCDSCIIRAELGDHFGEEKINLYQRCCPGYGSIFLFYV